MTQLKILGSSSVINCLKTTTELCSSITVAQKWQQRGYGSTTTTTTKTVGKPLKEMPSVNALKVFCSFMPGGKYHGADLNEISTGLIKDSGGDITMLSGLFGKPAVIITQNPDDFETIFRHDGVWPYRKGFELINYYRNVHRRDYFGKETGLLSSQNEDWGNMRSAANPIIIHPKNVKLYLSSLDKINQQFTERIKLIRDPQTLEVPVDFKDEISAWTLESVGMVALDSRLGLIDNTNPKGRYFFSLIQRFFGLAVDLELKPSLWRLYKTKKLKEVIHLFDETVRILDEFIKEAVERIENKKSDKDDAEKSVLEKLLAINHKYAVIMAMDMLFAGVDTTTSTFAAILLALSKHPEKQAKLRTEILGILPEKDTPLTVESMKNLPYLRACIKETLRYYPLTAANVRTTRQDLVLSGYTVPAGTEVAMLHLNLWRNAQHFSQPDEFIPERWLRENQTDSSGCPAATKTSHPFAYLPFGFGSRSCIGRRIAEMELEIGVARLLRNFQLEFNHPVDKPFIAYQLATPRIPLQFKFIDLKD